MGVLRLHPLDLCGTRGTGFVESNELKHEGDGVHFDAAFDRKFGRRYTKAFRDLAESSVAK